MESPRVITTRGLCVCLCTESGYRPRSYRGWVGGTLYPSSAPAGAPAAPGRSALPCFAAESARGGTLMSLPEGIATPAVRGTRLGASGGAVSSVVTSGCPKRSEGGFPVGTRTVTSASSAQHEEICGAPPPLVGGKRNEDERRPSRIRPLPFPDPKSVIRRY